MSTVPNSNKRLGSHTKHYITNRPPFRGDGAGGNWRFCRCKYISLWKGCDRGFRLDCCARPLLSSADWQRCRSSLCNAGFYIKWTSASTARLPWSYCCFLVLLAGERLAVQFCTGPPKIQFLPTQLLQATFKFHRRGQKQGGVGLAAAKGTSVEAAASVVSSQSGRHFHIKMTKRWHQRLFMRGVGGVVFFWLHWLWQEELS